MKISINGIHAPCPQEIYRFVELSLERGDGTVVDKEIIPFSSTFDHVELQLGGETVGKEFTINVQFLEMKK